MSKETIARRNAFVALCEDSSKKNRCWKLTCTTCGGGMEFKIAFEKIANDHHPDDEDFWDDVLGSSNNSYQEFFRRDPNPDTQRALANIVADASLEEVVKVAKYPDWLGYIGLVLNNCPDLRAREIISKSLIPQFLTLLEGSEAICAYLKHKIEVGKVLSVNDMSRIEQRNPNPTSLPLPLIFDVL